MDLIDITAPRVEIVKLWAGKIFGYLLRLFILFDQSCFLNSGEEGLMFLERGEGEGGNQNPYPMPALLPC